MPTIVAFLDVLGFSPYTEEDLGAAMMVLNHQQFILDQKLHDGAHHPAQSYSDRDLARVAKSHLVDSFQHFLPFSDSTFIVSDEPDKFVRQLSHFLIECLGLVGHVYAHPEDSTHTEAVSITDMPGGATHQEKWYPPLWRGGLAAGTLQEFTVCALRNRQRVTVPNLAGTAVVKAVRLEKTSRGPRLFCKAGFENHFGPDIRSFFRPVTASVNELLWPAFIYLDGNNLRPELQEFHTLWEPAVGLWKSKQGQPSFEHYDEFIRLLIRSFLCWGEVAGCTAETRAMAIDRFHADITTGPLENYLR